MVEAPRGNRRVTRVYVWCAGCCLAGLTTALARPTPAAAQEPSGSPETPAVIVGQAYRAVGADTIEALVARWRARVRRDSSDRLARLGIGMAAMLASDSAEADGNFHSLLTVRSPRDSEANRIAAYASYGEALLYLEIVRLRSAAVAFREAADAMRAIDDSSGEGRSLVYLVTLEARFRGSGAGAHLARADSVIPARDSALRGAWDCGNAAVLSAHHSPGVVAAADAGAALARRIGDVRDAALCEFEAGADLASQGRVENSIPRFRDVIGLSARAHDHGTHAIALQWLGYAELNMGRYGPAQDDLLAALAEASAHGSVATVAWSELNLAALAAQIDDAAGARRHAARALAAMSAVGDSAGLGLLHRGDARRALAVGDTAAARASALVALQAAERHGRTEDVFGTLGLLIAIDASEGRWDSAAAKIETQRAVLTANRSESWARTLPWDEGRISLGRGDPSTALRQFQRVDPELDSTQHLFREQLHADMSYAWLLLGDTARALAALERAENELDTWRVTLNDEGLRVLAFSTTDQFPPPAGENAEIIAAAARSHRTALGFDLAERQRARDLTDQMVRIEALGRAESSITPAATGSLQVAALRTITLAGLQQTLPDDSTALLEYVTGRGAAPTTTFVVTRHHVSAWLGPPVDSLVETIDRLDALIDHGVSATAPERALGTALLAHVGALPPSIHRLVIVPDGPLHRVPFAVLRLADGTQAIERYAISLAPSATVLVTEWRRPHIAAGTSILAFGDPVLPYDSRDAAIDRSVDAAASPSAISERHVNDSIATLGVGDRDGNSSELAATGTIEGNASLAVDRNAAAALAAAGRLPRLPWTADEAVMVGAFGQRSTVRLRAAASAVYLETTPLTEFSVVHFATHAVVDEDVPARSALALAPGGGQSGYVRPSDLAGLHLTADVVVLSACRTARGAVVTGEGVRGLTGPLLAAGAHSVLATQWRLNDRDAVPLVYTLYLEMARGLPVTEAVRRAELAALRAGRPEREWAAFTLVGDPLVRVPVHVPPPGHVPTWVKQYSANVSEVPARAP